MGPLRSRCNREFIRWPPTLRTPSASTGSRVFLCYPNRAVGALTPGELASPALGIPRARWPRSRPGASAPGPALGPSPWRSAAPRSSIGRLVPGPGSWPPGRPEGQGPLHERCGDADRPEDVAIGIGELCAHPFAPFPVRLGELHPGGREPGGQPGEVVREEGDAGVPGLQRGEPLAQMEDETLTGGSHQDGVVPDPVDGEPQFLAPPFGRGVRIRAPPPRRRPGPAWVRGTAPSGCPLGGAPDKRAPDPFPREGEERTPPDAAGTVPPQRE